MAHGMPRTRFGTARLVRVLTDLAVADVPAARCSPAERLGEWLGFTDALALAAALDAGVAEAPQGERAAAAPEGAALGAAFARVRRALAASITADGALEPAADFAPYQAHYRAQQRAMSGRIGQLRATVRSALARRSPALRRLAALDAVLDGALAARERALLARVPGLLARRFAHLCQAHEAPGAWRAAFRGEVQAVLLAELELRLQPVAGLIAALDNEVTAE
ncbi:MAG TPA: DUF3348 family protein [Polyangia bacterium]|jgi:hypothetical protein